MTINQIRKYCWGAYRSAQEGAWRAFKEDEAEREAHFNGMQEALLMIIDKIGKED